VALALAKDEKTMSNTHPRPWHTGSIFGDGYRRSLDREQRATFRYLLAAHRHAGRLTPHHELVGKALVRRLGVDGRCDPSHETIAADVGCSARTVRRATAFMRSLGLLRWQTRLVRAKWRAEQTSNAYELIPTLMIPPNPPLRRKADRCGGQDGRETSIFIDSGLKEGSDEWARWNRDRQIAMLAAGGVG
jgi:AraC-like DNA-binding protein